jgi:hypothetical protein
MNSKSTQAVKYVPYLMKVTESDKAVTGRGEQDEVCRL